MEQLITTNIAEIIEIHIKNNEINQYSEIEYRLYKFIRSYIYIFY